jgi:hypothetical protein
VDVPILNGISSDVLTFANTSRLKGCGIVLSDASLGSKVRADS